jgi:hypothetical protein
VYCGRHCNVTQHECRTPVTLHCETASMCTCSVLFILSDHCKNIMSGTAGVLLQIMAQTCPKEDQVIQSGEFYLMCIVSESRGHDWGTREKQAPYSGSCTKDYVYSHYVKL